MSTAFRSGHPGGFPQLPELLAPLFEPLRLGALTLPNRFVMPAMQQGRCRNGIPDPSLGEHYAARVRGGAGLIIGEACAIDHPSATGQRAAAQLNPSTLPVWRGIVEAVREAGGTIFLQLFHEGALRPEGMAGTLSPSGLAWAGRYNGLAATRAELVAIRDAYVEAAGRAKAIGAQGIEIHAAHGFLLDQFLWAETNLRGDGLGGLDLAERLAYPLEVIAAIRGEVGPGFPIGWRFSQWKEVDFGARLFADPGEMERAMVAWEAAGIDLFHASTRRFHLPEWPGSDLGLAGWATRLGTRPVIAVGSVGVRDVLFAQTDENEGLDPLASLGELARRFARGDFALVAVGRGMLGDPDWVAKLRNGDFGSIVPFAGLVGDPGDWDLTLVLEGMARPQGRPALSASG